MDILQAFKAIAEFLQAPDFFECVDRNASRDEVIYQLTAASTMAVRKVTLQGTWWKNSAEPLLCFKKESEEAMALLPSFTGRYSIVTGDKRNILTQKEAMQLDRHAFAFYPNLPQSIHTPKDILLFSLKGSKKAFLRLTLFTLGTTLLTLLPLLALQWIFNHIYDEGGVYLLWQIGLGLIIASVGSSLFLYLRNRTLLRLDGFFANHLQPTLWNRLFQLKPAFFRTINKGALFEKVLGFETLRESVRGTSAEVLFSSLFSFVYFLAMAFFSLPLTLIALLFIIAASWIIVRLTSRKNHLKNEIHSRKAERLGFLYQSLSAVMKVRAAGIEKQIFSLWKKKMNIQLKAESQLEQTNLWLDLLLWVLPLLHLGMLLLLLTLGWREPIGNLFSFYLAFIILCIAVKDLIHVLLEVDLLLPLLKKSEKIFEHPRESGGKSPNRLTGKIQFEKVCFSYSEEKRILDTLSFTIAPREKIGLIGPPAFGKTTIARLLLGLESPQQGAIFLDDQPLAHFNYKLLRRQIGSVFRTEGIFAGSLHSNIAVGRPCTLAQIEKAIDLADFREDVESFPMGLNTTLPEGGTTLSRGQRQRLLIARSLAFNPSLLVFDQISDALDPISYAKILNNLKTVPVTQIFIAQKEALEQCVDRIISLGDH